MRFLTLLILSFFSFTFAMAQSNPMKKNWEQVDHYIEQSLPKSALTELDKIYAEAKAKHDADNQVKALIYIMNCKDMSEEDAFEKDIAYVKTEIKSAQFPVNAVLQSMLGEMYWQYFQRRRYRSNISASTNVDTSDIKTWDQKFILEASIDAYHNSLKEKKALLESKTDIFQEVINKEGNNHFQTANLYDFLGRRALTFFAGSEAGVTRPAEQFNLNDVQYFSSSTEFVNLTIKSEDSLSLHLAAIRLMQDLEKIHLNDVDPTLLTYLVLDRLSFVKSNSGLNNTDELQILTLLKLEQTAIKLPVSTEVTFEIASIWKGRGADMSGIKQSPKYPDAYNKSIGLCDEGMKRFPNSVGAQQCEGLKWSILKPTLGLTIEEVNLPQTPFRALLKYNNIKKVHLKLIKLSADEVEKLNDELQYKYDEEKVDILRPYFNKVAVKNWSVDLLEDAQLREHSTEIVFDPQAPGFYLIVVGDSPELKKEDIIFAHTLTSVSNISFVSRTVDGKVQLYVLNRDNGKPVKGAKVKAIIQDYDYSTRRSKKKQVGEYTADADGYVEVTTTNDRRSGYVHFDITSGNDRLMNVSKNSSGFYVYKSSGNQGNYRPQSLLLFTDRAIYRPGQTVYFKGILYNTLSKNNYQVAKNEQVRISFYDANYKETAFLDLTTNEFGSIQGTFTTPVGSLTGQMGIGNDIARVNFNVEEYKRPKFEVKMQPLTGQYKLNQQIQVKGNAKAYAGNGVDGATVAYKVTRQVQVPYWYGRYWGGFGNAQETVMTTGTTTTDKNGQFTVNFTALPDPSVSAESKSTFIYTVSADVIDINGETRSDQTSISIGYSSLVLSIGIPANVEKSKSNKISLAAQNQSGQPEAANIKVEVFRLQAPEKALRKRYWESPDKPLLTEVEFRKLFPDDEYAKETEQENFPQKLILEKVVNTTADKAGEIAIPENWEPGQYLVKTTALDKDNVETVQQANFTLTDSKSSKLPFAMSSWAKVTPRSVEPLEKATFSLGSSFSDVHVLCEVERNGVIIKKEFLRLRNDIKSVEQLITEEDRGGLAVHYVFVQNNRVFAGSENIQVPFTNKELTIEWATFRNKLLPGQAEEWKLVIKKKNGEKRAAEFLATMYDASLDAFVPHNWPVSLYHYNYGQLGWSGSRTTFTSHEFNVLDYHNHVYYGNHKYFDYLNWFGYSFGHYRGAYGSIAGKSLERSKKESRFDAEEEVSMAAPAAMGAADLDVAATYVSSKEAAPKNDKEIVEDKATEKTEQPAIRKDFRETAFFFPDLKTDEEGNVVLKFTMPEALTRWRLMGFAHTEAMSYGSTEQETVTQKELMVTPNAPRFVREGDKLVFSAKVTKLSDKPLKGTVKLLLFDAATMRPIDKELGNIEPVKMFGESNAPSEVETWALTIPAGFQAITYRVIVAAGNYSDGEENVIPVFSNRMLVTESVPMVVSKGETKTYELEKLTKNTSKTLVNHRLTLELTPNPVWYAVQALPYLAEYPYECAEQTFSRYYANSLAGFVANSSPELKRMFELWKNLEPNALLSNLEKNQDLKMLLLEQTPWLRDAENETEQKRRIGLLFDLTRMNSELDRALGKLDKMQLSNGAWPWFDGMRDDRYITQHVMTGLGHLKHLGVKGRNEEQITKMTDGALRYCDGELLKDYQELLRLAKKEKLKLDEVMPTSTEVHYLYGRSFYDKKADGELAKAIQFYKDQSRKYWTKYELYEQALIGLTTHRDGNSSLTDLLHRSFKERAINSEDKGMYWKTEAGYYWYQAPIERQAVLVEFFEEAAKDRASVDKMRFWLLTQKQTTHWKTTKATTEAIYALLINGTSWLAEDPTLAVTVGGKKIDFPKSELNPTLTKVWNGIEVKMDMAKVTLSKQGEGIAWGALHWQYYEDLDKITTHKNTQVQLTKELMLEEQTASGAVLKPITASTTLKAGDLVKVKLVIRTDRDLEYVHVQDMRAAGFEPLNVLSGAKWNNSFGYYESTRDASTDFFIGFLPRGTFVFEYSLRVNNAGNFSNGITNLQCMYAPEFNAHSEGVRVEIK